MTTAQYIGEGRARRPWRLRTRLALALVALFIPLAGVAVLSHLETRDEQRDSEAASIAALDDTIAAVVEGFTNDLESFTLSIAYTVELATQGDTGAIQPAAFANYLNGLAQNYGTLRAIFITDTAGKILASQELGNEGIDLSTRPYIKALQTGMDKTWSGAFSGLESGQTTITFARTLRGPDGQPFAFLVAAFYADRLAQRLPQDLPQDATVSLIDQNGIVLFTSQTVGVPAGTDVSNSPVLKEVASRGQAVVNRGPTPFHEDDRYGAFNRIESTGWVVGLSRPSSAIDGPLGSRFRRDMLVMSALLLGSLGASLVIAASLAGPLSSLARAAAAITRGEKPAIPVSAADAEVHELARAMGVMSAAVEEREERLNSQTRILETLDRVGDLIATELDYRKAVAAISSASYEVTNAQGTCLVLRQWGREEWDLDAPAFAGSCNVLPFVAEGPLLMHTLEGDVQLVSDLSEEEHRKRLFSLNPELEVRSFLGIPIISRTGEILGGLFLFHSRANQFTAYHERLAIGLARRASVVLENARLFSEAQEAQDQLRAMNRAKTEFIGVMSHELRTPITTIYGGARLLQNRRKSLPEESTAEMIASIEEEAERLYRLVEDLLALARSDLGDDIATGPIELTAVVDRVTRQVGIRRPGRRIETRISDAAIRVQAESTYLYQVLYNLVTNADKYSEAAQPIEIEAERVDDLVRVRVLDRGPGVPQSELSQIFESFYRSQTTSNLASGKGLGLTVCRRLIEAMSGKIWAEARPGGGLTVAFELPVAAGQPAHEAATTFAGESD